MPYIKNPSIYIILNMLANPDDKKQLESIDNVNKVLKELAADDAEMVN